MKDVYGIEVSMEVFFVLQNCLWFPFEVQNFLVCHSMVYRMTIINCCVIVVMAHLDSHNTESNFTILQHSALFGYIIGHSCYNFLGLCRTAEAVLSGENCTLQTRDLVCTALSFEVLEENSTVSSEWEIVS